MNRESDQREYQALLLEIQINQSHINDLEKRLEALEAKRDFSPFEIGDRVAITCYDWVNPVGVIVDMDNKGNRQRTIPRYHVQLEQPIDAGVGGLIRWQYVTARHLELADSE